MLVVKHAVKLIFVLVLYLRSKQQEMCIGLFIGSVKVTLYSTKLH